MDPRCALGRSGEDAAAELYRNEGFVIVARNYRCPLGELDLVVARGSLLVFCEVKARRSAKWGDPYEAVDLRKQKRIRRLAAHWLAANRPGAVEIRFDVVSVVLSDSETLMEHIADAFD